MFEHLDPPGTLDPPPGAYQRVTAAAAGRRRFRYRRPAGGRVPRRLVVATLAAAAVFAAAVAGFVTSENGPSRPVAVRGGSAPTVAPTSPAGQTVSPTRKAVGPAGEKRHSGVSGAVEPDRPAGLAVAADGSLYVVDVGRDQVLRRLRAGAWSVVAGDGRQGFSGDGGPATAAELRLRPQSGIAISATGVLYIADTGNNRVRAVTPAGIITTVAGDGSQAAPPAAGVTHPASAPALTTPVAFPAGLTIGPDGELYIATSTVERLTPNGTLVWVAGSQQPACASGTCATPSQADLAYPSSLAFDTTGDLFVANQNNRLYELTPTGTIASLGQFRGDGGPGVLAARADGSIVEAWRAGVTLRHPDGSTTTLTARVDAALQGALGAIRGQVKSTFIGGDGLATGPHNTIYVDTDLGNTFTQVSAIIRINTTGQTTLLWSRK